MVSRFSRKGGKAAVDTHQFTRTLTTSKGRIQITTAKGPTENGCPVPRVRFLPITSSVVEDRNVIFTGPGHDILRRTVT